MWKVNTKTIPIKTRETGTISKSFRKYLKNVPGKQDIKDLQQTAILCTAHVLRKVATLKCKTFNMGNSITCSINCKYRIAATL